jgi:hypothetical protein
MGIIATYIDGEDKDAIVSFDTIAVPRKFTHATAPIPITPPPVHERDWTMPRQRR